MNLPTILRQASLCCLAALAWGWSAVAFPATSFAELTGVPDWTYWRGPEQNGISRETGLIDDFNPRGGPGSNVRWKRDDIGGRSTPVIMNGKLYTIVRADPETPIEGEKVVCVDAATGETIWENRFNVALSDVPDTRIGWSSVVADPESNRVFALGVNGLFQCIEAETGKTVWAVPMHERHGLLTTYGGRTNFPIVFDDLVIISGVTIGWGETSRPEHRFIAYTKADGRVAWMSGTTPLPEDTTYSAPIITYIDGQALLIVGGGDGRCWAYQPRTGKRVWSYRLSRRGLNTAPIIDGDTVYMGHSEENITGTKMGAVAAFKADGEGDVTASKQIWKTEEVMAGKCSLMLIDGRIYACEDFGKLVVLDAKTGERIGNRSTSLGTIMRSSPLYADGKLYIFESNGRWWIFAPDEDRGVKPVSKGRFPGAGEECHATPIAWNGRVYMQTTGAMYCLEDESKEHGRTPIPKQPEEAPVMAGAEIAQIQIVPADALARPGEFINFELRVFDAAGRRLGHVEADEFTVEGPGLITKDGKYEVPAGNEHRTATITANVGEHTAKCNLRIVPPLPWKFTFDDIPIDPETKTGAAPITWIGARVRHVVRKNDDGNNVLVKISTVPKGTRSQSWMGQSDLSNYTIMADVRGSMQNDKLPDIGLIAQGYTVDLQGEYQRLEIRTWPPMEHRMARRVDFKWEPNVWYTIKFQASLEGSKAVLRAKVWPRGEAEPAAWTLEATDDAPNLAGSPGMYGNATNAEIFIDNVRVFANGESEP